MLHYIKSFAICLLLSKLLTVNIDKIINSQSKFLYVCPFRFKNWGTQTSRRSAEDVAFAVAKFFQFGGAFQNYYMVIILIYIYVYGKNANPR